jgi:hypothetical protein
MRWWKNWPEFTVCSCRINAWLNFSSHSWRNATRNWAPASRPENSTGTHFSTDLDQYKNQTMHQQLVHQNITTCLLEIHTDSLFSATQCRLRNASWGAQKSSCVCLEKSLVVWYFSAIWNHTRHCLPSS